MPIPFQLEVISLVFGLCIGSFLNVCIYRLPESNMFAASRSRCPRCGKTIKFYDNIPVLSYIFLKGRCRHCQAPISFRYPMVELLTGIFALTLFMKYHLSFEALIYFIFVSALLVITYIDIDHRIIPDIISLPGIPFFFLASFLIQDLTWKDSLYGILAGGGSLFLVAYVYSLLTKTEGMGGGDIKLLAMIGACIGWKGALFTIFVSSAVGTVVGIAVMLRTRQNMKLAVPFGPFLAIGAIVYIYFGPRLIYWYFNLLG